MGSRLGRRVIHFANLPIKLLMPTSFNNIKEIALKTIPSASKIEIKRVLESLYGFDVEEVRTLNMEGKKKKRGGLLIAKPDYKKAYVTLKHPLSLSQDLYPIHIIEEDRNAMNKQSKSSIVEEGEVKSHWLDGKGDDTYKAEKQSGYVKGGNRYKSERQSSYGKGANRYKPEKQSTYRGAHNNRDERDAGTVKFPWSSMRSPK